MSGCPGECPATAQVVQSSLLDLKKDGEEAVVYIGGVGRGREGSREGSRTGPDGRVPVRAEQRQAGGPNRAMSVRPLSSTGAHESEYETYQKAKGPMLPLFESKVFLSL